MFIFRMIEFVFQLITAILVVLLLQISIGGRTLEDFFISFVQKSKTTAPIRQLAYSGVKYMQPLGVEAPSENSTDQDDKNRRTLASPSLTNPSSLTPIIMNWIGQMYHDNVEAYKNYSTQIGDHLKNQIEESMQGVQSGEKEENEISNEELMKEIVKEMK